MFSEKSYQLCGKIEERNFLFREKYIWKLQQAIHSKPNHCDTLLMSRSFWVWSQKEWILEAEQLHTESIKIAFCLI